MARALIVERDTTELRIVLQRGCRPVMAETITLTITRAGFERREPPSPCDNPCPPVCWLEQIADRPPSKIYHASRIELGLAIFTLDHDLIEAPGGWYRVMIEVEGYMVAVLPLLVRRSEAAISSYRTTCNWLASAE